MSYVNNDGSQGKGLTVQQLQLALVAIDPMTAQASLCAQYCGQLIFNYYSDMASKMTLTEFK